MFNVFFKTFYNEMQSNFRENQNSIKLILHYYKLSFIV